jgi:hypothetical protein
MLGLKAVKSWITPAKTPLALFALQKFLQTKFFHKKNFMQIF